MSGPTNQNPGFFSNVTNRVTNAIWRQPQQAAVVNQLQASAEALQEAERLVKEAHKQALGGSLDKVKEKGAKAQRDADKAQRNAEYEGMPDVGAFIAKIEVKIEKAKAAVAEAQKVVALGFAPGSKPSEQDKQRVTKGPGGGRPTGY